MKTEFVLSLGDQQWTLPDELDTLSIGRASNADIRLQADDQISRIHARLRREGDGWTLYDESRNGTGLNDRRITAPTRLTTGDRIHIGRSVLTFTKSALPGEPTPAETSAPEAGVAPASVRPGAPDQPLDDRYAAAPPSTPAQPVQPVQQPNPAEAARSTDEYAVPAPTPDTQPPAGSPFAPQQPPGANPFAPTGQAPGEQMVGAGIVPGFEEAPGRSDGDPWAAYPSADGPEPVRSPWEVSGQLDQSESNWNESASWPDPTVAEVDRRTVERRGERSPGKQRLPAADRSTDDDTVGTVRLPRVLIAAGGVIALGLIVNLVITFFADGPGGLLRWLVPPVIALVVAMVLTLLDAASSAPRRTSRLDVSVLIAIAVVLVGVGVGGFAVTAGAEYVGGYLSGNESGEDRLLEPIAKTDAGITVTVENVTYTSHFTRVQVKLANAGKHAITIPLDGTTFTAADGTALHADTGRSAWPSQITANGSADGTITFKGHLPDSAAAAVLTFKSGNSAFTIQKIALSN
ncbi:FHA domain-containing protein [Kribbella sp. NPDC048915]|uniref:FHA domain-containing protein n=1 Tax=Kribbella sp. NPDC048915 TaxID=3155148 RepID=UPI0033CA0A17